jgi:hypothetical protein
MSDLDLSQLASSLAGALVDSMVSDAWESVRDRLASALSARSESRQQKFVEQLEHSRAEMMGGGSPATTAARWQGRIEATLEEHPEIAVELRNLIEAKDPASRGPIRIQQAAGGDGAIINQGPGGIHHSGNVDNRRINNSSKKTSIGDGPIMAIVGIVIVALLGSIWAVGNDKLRLPDFNETSVISESTSCRNYLQFPTGQRDQAVKAIALDIGSNEAGSPLLRLDVDYLCGDDPDTSLGDAIRTTAR